MSRNRSTTDGDARPRGRSPRRGRGWRRVRRVLLAAAVIVVLVIGAAWLLVLRPSVLTERFESALSGAVGGDVEIDRARLRLDGDVVVEGLSLRVPTVDGPGGEVVRVDRVVIDVRFGRGREPVLVIDGVDAGEVRLRITEDRDAPGRPSFLALRPETPDRAGRALGLPYAVHIDRLIVETGSHDATSFEFARSTAFEADGVRDGLNGPLDVSIVELDPRLEPLALHGSIDELGDAWSLEVSDLDLGRRGSELLLPSWSELADPWDPAGTVTLRARGRISELVETTFETSVEGVTVRPPAGMTGPWLAIEEAAVAGEVRPPRIDLASGDIRIDGRGVTVDGLGAIVRPVTDADRSVMPAIAGSLAWRRPSSGPGSAAFDLRGLLEDGALEARIDLDGFDIVDDRPRVVVPATVRDVFERFGLRRGKLGAQVTIEGRIDGLEIDGAASIDGAAGRYVNFPYPLEDVRAEIGFDETAVELRSLTGRAAGGGTARLSGTIAPLTLAAGVDLQLVAEDLPLDNVLRDALPPMAAASFDVLLDGDAARAMRAGAKQVDERFGAAAGASFDPGGRVGLRLDIDRPVGRGIDTFTTGTIDVAEAAIVYRYFPYPIRVLSGRIEWTRAALHLGGIGDDAGLSIELPGGGTGRVSGRVLLPPDDDSADAVIRPELEIEVTADHITHELLSAFSLHMAGQLAGEPDAPNALAIVRTAASTDPAGRLDWQGRIGVDDAGRPDYDFRLGWTEGRLDLDPLVRSELADRRIPLPAFLRLDELRTSLHVTPDRVSLDRLDAVTGGSPVSASGAVAIDGSRDARLTLTIDEVALDAEAIALARRGSAVTGGLRIVEDIVSATGAVELDLVRPATGEPTFEARVRPRETVVRIGERTGRLLGRGGSIVVDGSVLRFDGLEVAVGGGAGEVGRLRASGAWSLRGPTTIDPPRIEVEDLVLDDPLVDAAIRRLAGEDPGSIAPGASGDDGTLGLPPLTVSGSIELPGGRPGAGAAAAPVVMRPAVGTLDAPGGPIDVAFDPGGRIEIRPGDLRLARIEVSGAGSRIGAHGNVRREAGGTKLVLDVDLDGHLGGPLALGLMPADAASAITDLGLEESAPTRIRRGRIEATWGNDGRLDVLLIDAVARFQDAALEAGVDVSGLRGRVRLDGLLGRRGQRLRLDGDLDELVAMGIRLGHTTTTTIADLDLGELRVESFRGRAAPGHVGLEATVGLDERGDFAFVLQVAGVDVAALPWVDVESEGPGRHLRRGELYGRIAVRGIMGDPASRQGVGELRVAQFDWAYMPIGVRVLQLVSFAPPGGTSWNRLDASVILDGATLVFEDLLIESPFLRLVGRGSLALDAGQIDLDLGSRGTLTVLDELFGRMRDDLLRIEVKGDVGSPRVGVRPLPGMGGGG